MGHRDNHTELRPEMVSFCERYRYSIQMACPYRPCHLSKGLHHPYSYAFGQIIAQNKPAIVSFYEKRATDREKHHVVVGSSLHDSLDGVNQSQALVP